jgi:hypothetical protein
MADSATYGDLEALLDEFQFGELGTAVTLIAASSQSKQTGAATGGLTLLGAAAGAQDKQTGAAEGVSVGGSVPVPVVPTAPTVFPIGGWGLWRPRKKTGLPKLPEEPVVLILATASGTQKKQKGGGSGSVALPAGARAVQSRQRSESRASVMVGARCVSMAEHKDREHREQMRREEELLVEFLLRAA